MGHVQIASQQFSDKIRVSVTRVKQGNTVLHPVPLGGQLRNLGLTLIKQPRIFTPSQQSTWPGNTDSAKDQQSHKRKRLGQTVFWKQGGAA